MPQIRYFHRGRYFRPSKPLHFLPPLKLTTGTTQHSLPTNEATGRKTSTRRHGQDRQHSQYKKLVITLARYLTRGNVADMKFLCRDHIRPPQIVDEVTSARHLLALLENQRLLAENSLYFLQTLLYYIARPDLYQIVLEFRAGRQEDYKEKGVDISDQYKVNLKDDVRRLEIAKELLKFRKDLKPRTRLNQIDVKAMQRKLEELNAKMHNHVNFMMRSNAQKSNHGSDLHVCTLVDYTAIREVTTNNEDGSGIEPTPKQSHISPTSSPKLAKSEEHSQQEVPKTRESVSPLVANGSRNSVEEPTANDQLESECDHVTDEYTED